MALNYERIKGSFSGALVGTFVGDALGAPLEGRAGFDILRRGRVAEMMEGRRGKGVYTDDTQMMIALTEALLESGGEPSSEFIVRKFLENYEPARGYGWGAHKLMQLWSSGVGWRDAAFRIFPDGSMGNGAAMRIAPVGVFYHRDRTKLTEIAKISAQVTHAHPLGMQGAVLQACAISLACNYRKGGTLSPKGFILDLLALAKDEFPDYKDLLLKIKEYIDNPPSNPVSVAKKLGTGFTAPKSVPTAICSFLLNVKSFEDSVVFAVNLGGDADTIGAMCGAISGAYFGLESIPARWLDELEDGHKGRSYVMKLSERLFELWVEKFQG